MLQENVSLGLKAFPSGSVGEEVIGGYCVFQRMQVAVRTHRKRSRVNGMKIGGDHSERHFSWYVGDKVPPCEAWDREEAPS